MASPLQRHSGVYPAIPRQTARRKGRSTEEPNAFRITQPSMHTDGQGGNPNVFLDVAASSTSPDTPIPLSPFAHAATESPTPPPPSDSTSWLPSTDLLSPTFNAHHFLQRVLSHSFDKTLRPARLPQLDDAFDADAALAALDTVESALRRRRDAARRDELSARETLRSALHVSAKRRDALIRTSHNVPKQVSTSGDVGRQAATALSTDLDSLKTYSHSLAGLLDARDLLSLLTRDEPELDSVRISKLLSGAKNLIQSGQLNNVLSAPDVNRARREILRCERQLESTIFDSMKRAVDDSNPHIISECALAAEQLGTSDQFIEAYVKYVFSLESPMQMPIRSANETTPSVSLETFRTACWEVSSIVRDSLSSVFESFVDPSRPLATLLQLVVEKKVIVVADTTLTALMNSIRKTEQAVESLKSCNVDNAQLSEGTSDGRCKPPVDRFRTRTLADSKETWRESVQRTSDERQRYLTVCVDIFVSLKKLRNELFDMCQTSGARDVVQIFSQLPDPYLEFGDKYLPQYLDVQKAWVDDRLAVAFFDITRIDTHAPRLAPRRRSNADVYHRYRSFYSFISSNFLQMVQKAIRCVHESLCQTVTVLSSSSLTESFDEASVCISNKAGDVKNAFDGGLREADRSEPPLERTDTNCSIDEDESKKLASSHRNPKTLSESRTVVRDFLDSLLMNYVANAETLLQAATHLLPVCEEDADMAELWLSGASPLTAYVQAIEVITKSNEILDEFLSSLSVTGNEDGRYGTGPVPEEQIERFVPQEVREALHCELMGGLSDLSSEAQVGVQAAVASFRARLFALLVTEETKRCYSQSLTEAGKIDGSSQGKTIGVQKIGQDGLENDPSESFMSALTFLEQQLQAVTDCVTGGNQEFVVTEMSRVTREVVLHCWCNIDGRVSVGGALQMVVDARAVVQVFQDRSVNVEAMECLPEVGQLFLEGSEGLWGCIESIALANVDAKVLIDLLRKREDFESENVVKVCQSLEDDPKADLTEGMD